jgi:hypothetical protein
MTMGRSLPAVAVLVVALAVALAACGARKPAEAPEPEPPPAPTTTPAQAVAAVVVANGCAHLGKANAKLAESAMNQLVDGCGSFKGSVRFTAQLLADGSIFFQPGPSRTETIPMCVLQHPLRHKIKLTEPCALDVRLEQSVVQIPLKGDGGT